MNSHNSAQQKAIDFLESLVKKHRRKGHYRLPTVQELADKAGVAVATMWKAVQRLKEDGILSAGQCRGIFIEPFASDIKSAIDYVNTAIAQNCSHDDMVLPNTEKLAGMASVPLEAMKKVIDRLIKNGTLDLNPNGRLIITSKSFALSNPFTYEELPKHQLSRKQIVSQKIESDIVNHVFPSGSVIPPYKELMLKYGSCFKTLKDVLGELSKNGLLLPHKRRYKIPSLSIRQGFTTITLVSYTVSAGDERHFKILQLLEERCSQMNITLKKVLLRKEEGKTGKLVRVGTGYYNFQERQERQKELQRGNFSFDTPEFTNTMGFIVFNMPFSAGEIASELASRFNVPIAILDQRDEYEFPSIPGTGTRIKRFTLSTTSRASTAVGRFLLSLGHRKIAYIATSHGQKWSSNRLQGLRNAWENTGTAGEVIACTCHYDAMESIPCTHVEIQAIARHLMRADIAIDKNVRTLFKKLSYNNPERIVGGLMREQYYEKLFGLFQQAYSYPDVTAWVAANDEIALHALGFLTRKRIKVPDDVSLVGFDDSLKANMSDLTSYNFNHTAIVQGILQHMMEPRAQVLRHKPEEQIEMEGFLVERGSTAKPRTTFFEHK